MKKIGCFKKEQNGWVGAISVLQFEAQARIVPIKAKASVSAPDFAIIKHSHTDAFSAELGAVWLKHSKAQRVDYLAVTLDDPALASPIKAVLWHDTTDDLWYLYWDRHATGEHIVETLYVQEDLKPQIGILPIMRLTAHMVMHYPHLKPT